MKRFLTMGLMVFAVVLLSLPAQAQPYGGRGRGGPGHGKWDKMAGNFENLRMLKLLEVLDLDESQSEKFIPLFHDFRRDMRDLQERKRDVIMQLSALVDSTGTDADILAEIDRLQVLQQEIIARTDKFTDDVGAVLTVQQLGRFVIFQERFEREILRSLREFRRPPDDVSPPNESEGK